jgi:hypothetical protein
VNEQKKQKLIASIIDTAVDCWHEVADDHDIEHCNCFRDVFAQRLIDQDVFIGYTKLNDGL